MGDGNLAKVLYLPEACDLYVGDILVLRRSPTEQFIVEDKAKLINAAFDSRVREAVATYREKAEMFDAAQAFEGGGNFPGWVKSRERDAAGAQKKKDCDIVCGTCREREDAPVKLNDYGVWTHYFKDGSLWVCDAHAIRQGGSNVE